MLQIVTLDVCVSMCVCTSCDHAALGKGQPGPPGLQVNKSLFYFFYYYYYSYYLCFNHV